MEKGGKGEGGWERHIGERKDTAPGIEREKCLKVYKIENFFGSDFDFVLFHC